MPALLQALSGAGDLKVSQTWPLSRMRSQSGGETGVDTGNDNDKPVYLVLGQREAIRMPLTNPGGRRVRESPGMAEVGADGA